MHEIRRRPLLGWVLAASLLIGLRAQSMTLKTPPIGVNAPITGSVSGLPQAFSQYKVGILVSSDGGNTWWDKTHDYPNGVPLAVVLGIPLNADGTFTITGWIADPHDQVAPIIRVLVVPQSFSFLWPGYQVEGTAYPQSLLSATVASYTVNRETGAVVQFPGGAAVAPAPAGTTGTLTITAFPAAGTTTAISGIVTGLPGAATGYKVVVYLQGGGLWYIKPQPGTSTPLKADGSFSVVNWASYPAGDVNFQALQLYVVPAATADANVVGAPLPAALEAAAAAKGNYPNGYKAPAVVPVTQPVAASPAAVAASTVPVVTAPTLTLTAFPATGTVNAISGKVTGVATPANYKVVLYLQGGGTWWSKPQPGQATPIAADGTFTIAGWATYPAGDVNFQALQLYVIPQASAAVSVLGGPLPAAVDAAAVLKANYPQGYKVPAVVVPAPPVAASSAATVAASKAPTVAASKAPTVAASKAPTVAASLAAVPVVTAPTLTLTAFPATGTVNAISGKVTGVATPANYKVVLYLQGGGTWWSKPQPGQATPIAADGTFTIAGWATYPAGDVNFQAIQLYVIPQASAAVSVLGGPLPAAVDAAAVLKANYPQGYKVPTVVAPAASASPAAAAPTVGTGVPVVSMNGIPAGSINALTGKITGLTGTNTNFKTVLYVQDGASGVWWGPKPQPAVAAPVGTDFSFAFDNWASSPNDANVNLFTVAVLPAAFTAPTVLGAALPTTLTANSLAVKQFDRSGDAGSAPAVIPVVNPPSTAAGEVAWPPAADPGPKTGHQNGYINFAGYRWLVKETNGGRVGPGENIFSRNVDHIWTDAWGLHMNVMPTNGCNRWISTEVTLDHTLGYGTYLFRYVSPVEFLDPDVTWSPFFLWDDSGGGYNGFREIDFEAARWGDGNDPSSSQFVLKPLQTNGMVPGWKVRYDTKANQLALWQGNGQGYGACNQAGQTDFNGAGVSRVTCALRWGPGKLFWYCADGFFTLQTMGQVPVNKRLAAYVYRFPQYVPDVGDNRVHINLWLQNGAQPRWGRRTHAIIAGFEFNKNYDMTFPIFGDGDLALTQRSLQQVEEEDVGRNLQERAPLSNGDPSGRGMALTMLAIQADAMAESSTGQRLLAEAEHIAQSATSSDNVEVSRLLAGAAIFGGLVGMVSMFFAGYTVANGGGRKSIDLVKRTMAGVHEMDSSPVIAPGEHVLRDGKHFLTPAQ